MAPSLKTALALALFCAGLTAGWWFAGYLVSTAPFASSRAAAAEQSGSSAPVPSSPAATLEARLAAIMSAVADSEPLQRAVELHDLLATATAPELATLWPQALSIRDAQRRASVINAILERWITVDAAGARAAVAPYRDAFRKQNIITSGSAELAVARAWAELTPEESLAEAAAQPEQLWASLTGRWAIDVLFANEPLRQLELLASLPAGKVRTNLSQTVLFRLADQDPLAAEARLDLIADPPTRAMMRANILKQLAQTDPDAALRRFQELSPDLGRGAEGARVANSIFSATAGKDVAKALAALDQVPPHLQPQVTSTVLAAWAKRDPVAALTWASEHSLNVAELIAPEFVGTKGLVGGSMLISQAYEADREKTLAWVRAQPPSPMRDDLLSTGLSYGTTEQKLALFTELSPAEQASVAGSLAGRVAGENTPRCQQWIDTLPSGRVRSAAVENLAGIQISRDPQQIETVLESWASGSDRDSALKAATDTVSFKDPARAVDYARRIADPNLREDAFESLASTWRHRDVTAAKKWLAASPDFTAEKKATLLRQFDE